MKKLLLFVMLLGSAQMILAENIDLKITYNGTGISGHTVSVMVGGAKLGSGVTDSQGEVSIMVSSIPTNRIDLKGEKKCDGAEKSWEVSGFVTLDGNNYAHLKMEVPIGEMVEASGGFMSEKMMVASYGLVCGGSSSKTDDQNSSSNTSSSNSTPSPSETHGAEAGVSAATNGAPPLPTREEGLANQKVGFENKISNYDRKIAKTEDKIPDLEGKKKTAALYDVEEMKIEKKIAQNKLDKVNAQIENGLLNKTQRTNFKDKEKALKAELDQVKDDKKSGKSIASGTVAAKNDKKAEVTESAKKADNKEEEEEEEEAEEEEVESIEVSAEDMLDMNMMQLKNRKMKLKTALGKKKMKLKTKKKFLSPNDLAELEGQIAEYETVIATLEAEILKREEAKTE